MKTSSTYSTLLSLLVFLVSAASFAQLQSGVYLADHDNVRHELKVTNTYMILTLYESSPAKFIKTLGGFYTAENGRLNVQLEFNSNYETDSVTTLNIPYKLSDNNLVFNFDTELTFNPLEAAEQELDGQWLFATRGPDEGQKRRGDENARKTLKYLQDNRFQWIAYNTDTFRFHGTGGGSFSSEGGNYIETIEFFSRDNARVGAVLKFKFETQGDDWHHKGNNSKGEPMYEIWGKRK